MPRDVAWLRRTKGLALSGATEHHDTRVLFLPLLCFPAAISTWLPTMTGKATQSRASLYHASGKCKEMVPTTATSLFPSSPSSLRSSHPSSPSTVGHFKAPSPFTSMTLKLNQTWLGLLAVEMPTFHTRALRSIRISQHLTCRNTETLKTLLSPCWPLL